MATIETQNLIINTAVNLFNEQGTHAVSTNRVADECHLSHGNLHYHYKNKEALIQAIFQRMGHEMDNSWYEDHEHPSMAYTHFMFARQADLSWRYRFFYRELHALLQNDPQLKCMYMDCYQKRMHEMELYFTEMINIGLMRAPQQPVSLKSLLQVSWLVCNHWVYHLELTDEEVNEDNIRNGFKLICQSFLPYLAPKAVADYRNICRPA